MENINLNDDELLRYSRQIMLSQIGIEGQQKLLNSKVLLFGAGGLGSPVAMYLVASGIGELTISDPDRVDLSNLQRQILHGINDIDKEKVYSAKQTLSALNPNTDIRTFTEVLSGDMLNEEVRRADVVVDATDNFKSRFTINKACVNVNTALVSGAAIRLEGQVAVFSMQEHSACYQCLFADNGKELEESCSETGVLGSVTGLIGSIQATEVIKLIVNAGQLLTNKVLLIDALNMDWRSVNIKKDPKCVVCS